MKHKKKNKTNKPAHHKIRHYTNVDLFIIAFDIAYPQYFKTVDSEGKPIEINNHPDFDYRKLSEEEQDIYDDNYDSIREYCEELYERETKVLTIDFNEDNKITELHNQPGPDGIFTDRFRTSRNTPRIDWNDDDFQR